jgi:tetratricopeptide (TPR) repeat protein
LLYVLLAGRHPLQLSGSRAARIKAALNGKLPRASEFASGPLRKQLRGDLDAILGRALHFNPEQRYQTAAALRDDLVHYLNREPVSARRGAGLYTIGKFIDRHRVAAAVSFVAVMSLCGMLAFALAQGRLAANERDHAFGLATRNAAVTEFLGTLITEAAESDKPVTVTEMLARSEKLALEDTGSPETRAAVLQMIAERFASLDDGATAERLFKNGLSLLANSHDHGLRSTLECEHASTIAQLGQIDAAERTLQRVLRQEHSDPQIAANCLYFLSDIATSKNQAQLALSYAKQALARLREAPRIVATEEPLFLDAVGYGYYMQGRIHEADQYYREAVQKYSQLGRAANANSIAVRNDWAVVLNGAGAPKRALDIFDGTLRLMAEHYQGEAPPPSVVGNRARVLEAIGRFEEARAAYGLELQIAQQRQNIESQALALTGLAITAQDLHDPSAAAQYLQHFTSVSTPSLPAEMLPWQWYAIAQARLDMADGNFAAARAHFAQALGSSSNAAVMTARLGKSEAELRAGDSSAALEDARLAMQTATKMQGDLPYSNFTGLSWRALGQAQQELSHDAEAQHAFENAELQLSNTVDNNHPALVEVRNRLPPNRQ